MVKSRKGAQLAEIWRRYKKNKTAVIGLIILAVIIGTAVFADLIVPYAKCIEQVGADRLQGPSAEHWFGTDEMGRDIFNRVMYGSTTSLSIGIVTVIVALTGGLVLGAAAGYYGGKVDMIIMRAMDVFLAVPGTLLAICIVASLGNSIMNLVIAVMTARDAEYVEAARAIGAKDARIIFKDVLPNSLAPIIVQTTLQVASVILSIAGLSFIGLGIPAPRPEWGAMLSASRAYIRDYSYMCLFPGLAIMTTILSLNLLGDGLRDALDPRLR